MQVEETCIGCYYLDYYAGQSYCCLSNPEIDVDGFCNSKITEHDLDDLDDWAGQLFSP